MRTGQLVTFGVVVLVAALAVAAPVVGALPAGQFQTEEPAGDGAEFGQQITSFAQASAVDANASADQGMWAAGLNSESNDTDGAEEAVTDRAETLEHRLARLENQSAALQAQHRNGTISETAYTARASALRVRVANLREAVTETDRAARRVGVNVTKLDDIRDAAFNMSGPEVAEIARNITDVPRGPPDEVPSNPPDDAGPPDDQDTGPPDDQDTGPPDDQDTGP
ncbi:MAG: hypothetical protein V5A39_12635, partial [Haloarculaceae archaeon]